MARRKREYFDHNTTADNVIEPEKPLYENIKGRWNTAFFTKPQPIVLELACGKGEYSIGLAKVFPEKNFIGIDLKGDRLARGSRIAIAEGLTNVGFLRTVIQNLDTFFEPDEISEIWVTFPDPRPRKRDIKRRLTHPRFLSMYASILQENGLFHLKTDSSDLFDFTLETLEEFGADHLIITRDLYASELNNDHHGIKTRFETLFYEQGYSIKYLRCCLKKS